MKVLPFLTKMGYISYSMVLHIILCADICKQNVRRYTSKNRFIIPLQKDIVILAFLF